MSALGEIARLSRTARPSAGIITMIGVSHLESLGSRENILKAKLEICQGLPDGAPLVLNADDDLLPGAALPARLRPVWFGIEAETADVRAVNIRETQDAGTDFTIQDSEYGEFSVHIPTVGRHTVYGRAGSLRRRDPPGLDPARASAALARYQTTGMRQNLVTHGGVTLPGRLLQRQPGQHARGAGCAGPPNTGPRRAADCAAWRYAGTGRSQ